VSTSDYTFTHTEYPSPSIGTKTLKATEYYKPLVEGDILESDDKQRAIVASSYAALALLFTKGCVLLPAMSMSVAVSTLAAVLVIHENMCLCVVCLCVCVCVSPSFVDACGCAGKEVSFYLCMSVAFMCRCSLSLKKKKVGYEFADLGSGVYHWSMDNYGSKDTPIFGTQIEAFQGHHELPVEFTKNKQNQKEFALCS
jgi:hypothetical protein